MQQTAQQLQQQNAALQIQLERQSLQNRLLQQTMENDQLRKQLEHNQGPRKQPAANGTPGQCECFDDKMCNFLVLFFV